MFGAATGISPGFRIDEGRIGRGQLVSVTLECDGIVAIMANLRQLPVHDVALEQDHRFAVVEETGAF
ncbi:hypothetical protein D3C84_1151710 [compost metagenome]